MARRDGPPVNGSQYCGNGLRSQMEVNVPVQNPDMLAPGAPGYRPVGPEKGALARFPYLP